MNDTVDTKGAKGSATAKVRKLQKQYNKILVDLFDQFAAESIEEALDKNEGSFGENIQDIVSCALENLKGKVMDELGIKGGAGEVGDVGITIGGIDLTDGMDMNNSPFSNDSEEDEEEHKKHEESETEEEEKAEHEDEDKDDEKDEDEDKDDEEIKESYTKNYIVEKAPPGEKMERVGKQMKRKEKAAGKSDKEAKQIAYATTWKKHNESDESIKREKVISESRRSDQSSLIDIYDSILKQGK